MSADDQWVVVVADAIEGELRSWEALRQFDPVMLRASAEACARRAQFDLELVEGIAREDADSKRAFQYERSEGFLDA